jgi:chorismate-pyruvate lyase
MSVVFPEHQADPLEPLASLYAWQGAPLPRMRPITPEDMPQPYRQLLVHSGAMTPTLERFTGQRLELKVLDSHVSGTTLRRQVVLVGAEDGRAVEFGAIRINLSGFDGEPGTLLRQGSVPMGRLLGDFNIPYSCRPALFLRVEADAVIRKSLGLEGHTVPLFGRCNQILAPDGQTIADVVEVLAELPEGRWARQAV